MIPCDLTGYHSLSFDFEAVLFLETSKIRQTLRRIKSNHIHNSNTKALFKDIELSYTFSFTATGILMFHLYIRRLQYVVLLLRTIICSQELRSIGPLYYKKRRIHSMRAHLDNALQITHGTSKDASSIIGITCHHHNGTPFQGFPVAPRGSSVPTMHSCSIQ